VLLRGVTVTQQNNLTQTSARLQAKKDELLNLRFALKRTANPHLIKRLKAKKSRLMREIEGYETLLREAQAE
jgi:hypothetical protein